MRKSIIAFMGAVAVAPLTAHATLSFRTAVIEVMQVESHERVGREDVIWLKITGSWSGVTCNADWGWFNSKTSPQLLATSLTARATGASLQVYVDDGAPKLEGYCQITVLTL